MIWRNYLSLMNLSFIGGMAWAFLVFLIEFFIWHPSWEIRRSDVMLFFIGGIAFWISMFLVMCVVSILSEGTIKKKYGPLDSYYPVQIRIMTVNEHFQTVFKKCLDSLSAIGAGALTSDPEEGKIRASTKISWRSFGEFIEIRLYPKGTDTVEVTIFSIPKMLGSGLDYIKGVKNVEELRKAIAGER